MKLCQYFEYMGKKLHVLDIRKSQLILYAGTFFYHFTKKLIDIESSGGSVQVVFCGRKLDNRDVCDCYDALVIIPNMI